MSPEQRRLMELHDGELEPGSKEALEAEVRDNPAAQAELRGLVLLGDLVREVASSRAAPPDLADAILARTAGAPVPARRSLPGRRWPRLAAPAAGMLALAAAAVLVINSSQKAERTSQAMSVASAPALKPAASVALAARPSEGVEAGVSIQSVDFGSTQGAIFLVPGGQSETMVVWTLEDANDKG